MYLSQSELSCKYAMAAFYANNTPSHAAIFRSHRSGSLQHWLGNSLSISANFIVVARYFKTEVNDHDGQRII